MPIFEYKCENCGKVIEVFVKSNDDKAPTCEDCKKDMKKIISLSSFHLKGKGWYKDGY